MKSGTDLSRQRKGGERVIETLRSVVRESDDSMHVVFPANSQTMRRADESKLQKRVNIPKSL